MTTKHGYTPLYMAAANGHREVRRNGGHIGPCFKKDRQMQNTLPGVRIRLHWLESESEIDTIWVHREFNLMLTLSPQQI